MDRSVARAVDAVVLVGAFPGHRRGYVLDGTGRGVVGSDALEVLRAAVRGADATSFDPRAPLARELPGTWAPSTTCCAAGAHGSEWPR